MAGLPWLRIYTDLPRDPRSLVLGRLLGDDRAWTYVVALRLWMAEHAASGGIDGPHAEVMLEAAAGWRGAPGALVSAALEAGFVRAGPSGDGFYDVDWEDEQGAHIAKFQRDAKKPRGNKRPARDSEGTSAGPAPVPSGESREKRVEIKKEETTLSSDDDLPDATEDAQPLLVDVGQQNTPPNRRKQPKVAPKTSEAERSARAKLEAVYAQKRPSEGLLPWKASTWPALRTCLASAGGDVGRVVSRFTLGLDLAAEGRWGGTSSVEQLASRWADLASIEAKPRPTLAVVEDEKARLRREAYERLKAQEAARKAGGH